MHWCYELVENDLLWFFSLTIFIHIKRSYYWFNRQELLEKGKDRYHNRGGKKEAAEYCISNQDFMKEKAKNKYRKLSEEAKEAKRGYGRNMYKTMKKNLSQKGVKEIKH